MAHMMLQYKQWKGFRVRDEQQGLAFVKTSKYSSQEEEERPADKQKRKKTCFHCGKKGHIMMNCPDRNAEDG